MNTPTTNTPPDDWPDDVLAAAAAIVHAARRGTTALTHVYAARRQALDLLVARRVIQAVTVNGVVHVRRVR